MLLEQRSGRRQDGVMAERVSSSSFSSSRNESLNPASDGEDGGNGGLCGLLC